MRAAVLLLLIAGSVAAEDFDGVARRKAMPKDQTEIHEKLEQFAKRRAEISEITNPLAKQEAEAQYSADVKKWSEAVHKQIAKIGLSGWVGQANVGAQGVSIFDGRFSIGVRLGSSTKGDMREVLKTLERHESVRFTLDPKHTRVTIALIPYPVITIIADEKGLAKIEKLKTTP